MRNVKTLLVITASMLLVLSAFAGNVLPQRSTGLGQEVIPATEEQMARTADRNATNSVNGTLATISWTDGLTVNTNFGGWTGDYFFEYFVPAAGGILRSVDFNFSDLPAVTGGAMSVNVYASNYDWAEINTEAIADASTSHLGYYDEASGMEVYGTNWVQGGINGLTGADPDFNYDPLDAQVWPFFGAASISLEPNADDGGWVNLDLEATMGTTYEFAAGDTFIIVTKFSGFPDDADGADYRMGFMSAVLHYDRQPGLKFYGPIGNPTGRLGNDDWGWYIRSYAWDWIANVEYTTDRGPEITDVTSLAVTLDQGARSVTAKVTDDNPGGGAFGVDSVNLMVSVNGGDFSPIAMTANDTAYIGEIPGLAGGDVSYYVEATDVEGLYSNTIAATMTYSVFVPGSDVLVVFNGGALSGYPADYYFGIGAYSTYETLYFGHDVWNGEIIASLASAYSTIYEITTDGPTFDNRAVIAAWLDEGAKNYFLAGDEWFGALTNWTDGAYVAGDFEYDVLGIAYIYNDINAGTGADAIEAVDGNVLTGDLYTAHTATGDTLLYDPAYEIGVANWLDGFDAVDAGDVNMTTFGRTSDLSIGLNRTVGDDKVVFLGFDPLSMNASPYTWYGFSAESAQTKSVYWFDILVVSTDETAAPTTFELGSAYPNPFNPVTNITYSLPSAGDVKITVFNTLGQEVTTLVNSNMTAGNYTASWNGSNSMGKAMPSGLYFYSMEADGFTATNKMLLLK